MSSTTKKVAAGATSSLSQQEASEIAALTGVGTLAARPSDLPAGVSLVRDTPPSNLINALDNSTVQYQSPQQGPAATRPTAEQSYAHEYHVEQIKRQDAEKAVVKERVLPTFTPSDADTMQSKLEKLQSEDSGLETVILDLMEREQDLSATLEYVRCRRADLRAEVTDLRRKLYVSGRQNR